MPLTPESFTQQTVSNQAANMAPLADELLQQQGQGGIGMFHKQEPNNYPHNIQYSNNAPTWNNNDWQQYHQSTGRKFFGLGGTSNYSLVTGAAAIGFIVLALKEGLMDKKTMCLGTFIAGWLAAGAAYASKDLIKV